MTEVDLYTFSADLNANCNCSIFRSLDNVLQLERAPVPQGVQHQAGGALQEVPGQVPAPGDDQVKMSGQASDVMI